MNTHINTFYRRLLTPKVRDSGNSEKEKYAITANNIPKLSIDLNLNKEFKS